MILRAYTIYDNKVQAYHQPFFAATDGAATRSFQDLANDLNTSVGRHPRDYSLHCIGTFEDANAFFEVITPRLFVAEAYDLVHKQPSLPIDNAEPV